MCFPYYKQWVADYYKPLPIMLKIKPVNNFLVCSPLSRHLNKKNSRLHERGAVHFTVIHWKTNQYFTRSPSNDIGPKIPTLFQPYTVLFFLNRYPDFAGVVLVINIAIVIGLQINSVDRVILRCGEEFSINPMP